MKLTYLQFISLGQLYYNEGGDNIVECWSEEDFNEYVEMFGDMTDLIALDLIKMYDTKRKEILAEADEPADDEEENADDEDICEWDFYDDQDNWEDHDEWDDLWNARARSVGAI